MRPKVGSLRKRFRLRMHKLARFFSSPAGLVLRYAVSLGLILALAWQVDWGQLGMLHGRLAWGPLAASLLLALLAYPLCAWRWWWLLRTSGAGLPFSRAHAITWIGQFYNAFLPGGIGGDATRLLYAFGDRPDRKAAATAATAVDRALGFTVLVLLAAGALAFVGTSVPGRDLHGLAWGLAGGVAVISTVVWLLLRRALPRLPASWAEAAGRLYQAPRAAAGTTLLSAGVWVLDFASGWFLAQSLGLHFDPMALAAALGLAYLSTVLPISLGGHGLRESSLVLALHWLGQTNQTGTDGLAAFALLFLTVSLATSLVGGVVLLIVRRRPAPAPRG